LPVEAKTAKVGLTRLKMRFPISDIIPARPPLGSRFS
jgi:hypothetical protein